MWSFVLLGLNCVDFHHIATILTTGGFRDEREQLSNFQDTLTSKTHVHDVKCYFAKGNKYRPHNIHKPFVINACTKSIIIKSEMCKESSGETNNP